MKIDLTNIPPEGKKVSFRFTADWWKSDFDIDQIVGLEGPLSASIHIYPAGKKTVVEGFLSARLLLRCDRCLESYGWDLSTDFRVFLAISPFKAELEVELSEDDLDLDFIEGNYLHSDQIIKEQLILNLPMKNLCTIHCKGLCPICGSNLNKTECSCLSRHEGSLCQEY